MIDPSDKAARFWIVAVSFVLLSVTLGTIGFKHLNATERPFPGLELRR